jgi:transcription elongation factor Elf1
MTTFPSKNLDIFQCPVCNSKKAVRCHSLGVTQILFIPPRKHDQTVYIRDKFTDFHDQKLILAKAYGAFDWDKSNTYTRCACCRSHVADHLGMLERKYKENSRGMVYYDL